MVTAQGQLLSVVMEILEWPHVFPDKHQLCDVITSYLAVTDDIICLLLALHIHILLLPKLYPVVLRHAATVHGIYISDCHTKITFGSPPVLMPSEKPPTADRFSDGRHKLSQRANDPRVCVA